MSELAYVIPPEEWIHLASPDLNDYTAARYTHCRPERGKNKFYVSRKPDGSIVSFCQHCRGGGTYYPDKDNPNVQSTGRLHTMYGEDSTVCGTISLPGDAEGDSGKWHHDAAKWIRRYLTDEEVARSPVCYSPDNGAVLFPLRYHNDLAGYQMRKIPTPDDGAKYLSYWADKGAASPLYDPFFPASNPMTDTLVVTEDYLSAYKVALHSGCAGFPALGTHIPEPRLRYIVPKFSKVLIALDNDSIVVCKAQHDLYKRFSMHLKVANIILSMEFKAMAPTKIRQLLNNAGV